LNESVVGVIFVDKEVVNRVLVILLDEFVLVVDHVE
jgi:hypothetical protein